MASPPLLPGAHRGAARICATVIAALLAPGCDGGPAASTDDGGASSVPRADMAAAPSLDAGDLDHAIDEQDGGRVDEGIPDADDRDLDATRPDVAGDASPVDGSDADRAPTDAMVEPDLYPFEPDPICAELTPIDLDPFGDYALVPSPLGDLMHVDDLDGDGRSELFVLTRNVTDRATYEEAARAISVTIYAWGEGGDFIDAGDIVGTRPLAVIDLGGPIGNAIVGAELFVDIEWENFENTLGVRADGAGAAWRFDTSVRLFVHPEPWGELTADYFAPFDVEVFDGDGDGLPELLTFSGDLIEWKGDDFEVTWRVIDADPRDEVREIGGGSLGRLAHGDFDGDGRMDFVIDGYGGVGTLGVGGARSILKHARVFENQGDDDYRLVTRLPYGANNAQFAGVGDIDGDGRPEFLYGGAPGSCIRFEIWSGVADDTYVRLARIDHVASRGIPTNQGITAFGDLDGDGDDELVANIGQSIVAWDWDGMALRQILSYPYCENCNWHPVWTGDLEGDGIDEIFFSERTHQEVADVTVLSPTGVRVLRLNAPAD